MVIDWCIFPCKCSTISRGRTHHTSNGSGIVSTALMFTVAATRSHNRTQRWICTPTDSWHYVQIKSVDAVDYFPAKLHNFGCSYKSHTLHRLFNLKRRATDEITSEHCCLLRVLKSVWSIQMGNVIIELNLIGISFFFFNFHKTVSLLTERNPSYHSVSIPALRQVIYGFYYI